MEYFHEALFVIEAALKGLCTVGTDFPEKEGSTMYVHSLSQTSSSSVPPLSRYHFQLLKISYFKNRIC